MISTCMMVKNEQKYLKYCLEHMNTGDKELIVIDTGSEDDTMNIARSFDAKVFENNMTKSFAEVRNKFFDYATGEWILVIDGDETLFNAEITGIESIPDGTLGFVMPRYHYLGSGHLYCDQILRFFRNGRGLRYSGDIFEVIDIAEDKIDYLNTLIHHFGYLKDDVFFNSKMERYIEMGKKLIQSDLEKYGEVKVVEAYSMIAVSYICLNDFEKALEFCQEGKKIRTIPWFFLLEGSIFKELGQYERADESYSKGIEFCKTALTDDTLLLTQREYYKMFMDKALNKRGMLYIQTDKFDEAEKLFNEINEDSIVYLPSLINKGTLFQKQGRIDQQRECFDKAIAKHPYILEDSIQKTHIKNNYHIISDISDSFISLDHSPRTIISSLRG